jgi:type I restriction enzyme M protein
MSSEVNKTSSIVSKVWSFASVLRDDGVGYGHYLEQLTYLLFLKLADEYSKPPYNRSLNIPAGYDWQTLTSKRGSELEDHYNDTLRELANARGFLGQIFTKSQSQIKNPAILFKVIDMIDKEQWSTMGADIKGDIYEGLLEKNAQDTASGAGQYFTPRPLIGAIVECIRPEPMKTIADPACGTGGFFLAAYDFIANTKNYSLNREEKEFLKLKTFYGNEIVPSTRRLALMNLFLHNIGDFDSDSNISQADALISDPGYRVDYVLANPPFGNKSSLTVTNEAGALETEELTYNRQDFYVTTSNKQFNFLQHIKTMLKSDGKAAVVMPDNILFEGGAGETVRKKLLETTNLHTILRLPTGIFYAQGVKANVLFFDNKPSSKDPWTKEVWIYDFRTNIRFTLKRNPLKFEDLADFISCYKPDNIHLRQETYHSESNPEGRWRKFSYSEIVMRDKTSLDITWIKDNSLKDLDNLPDPDVLAGEIIENLQAGIDSFKEIMLSLKS